MGGTAVAVHLRRRVSEDLEVMTLRSFSGSAVEEQLRETVNSVEPIEVSDSMFHRFVDGVKVDVFRALPTNGVAPEQMRWICPGTRISGMEIGSIPDLMASNSTESCIERSYGTTSTLPNWTVPADAASKLAWVTIAGGLATTIHRRYSSGLSGYSRAQARCRPTLTTKHAASLP